MKHHTSQRRGWALGSFAVLFAFVAYAPAETRAQAPFDQIVVFGTSLSDSGNAFALVGGVNTPPDYFVDPFLVPDRPYAGQHFSNGATWIEQFAQPLGLAGSVQPAFRSSAVNATNFAVGAARARPLAGNAHLSLQVGAFLASTGNTASSEALYVIEMGSGDVRDALFAALTGGDPATIRQQAVASIFATITALHAAGAREFLIWNVPDISLTPSIRRLNQLNPGAAAVATAQTVLFNAALSTALAALSAQLGIDFNQLDVFQKMSEVVSSPASFDLSNVTSACITPSTPPFRCRTADDFLFWDGLHPTQAGHAILAEEARIVLGL